MSLALPRFACLILLLAVVFTRAAIIPLKAPAAPPVDQLTINANVKTAGSGNHPPQAPPQPPTLLSRLTETLGFGANPSQPQPQPSPAALNEAGPACEDLTKYCSVFASQCENALTFLATAIRRACPVSCHECGANAGKPIELDGEGGDAEGASLEDEVDGELLAESPELLQMEEETLDEEREDLQREADDLVAERQELDLIERLDGIEPHEEGGDGSAASRGDGDLFGDAQDDDDEEEETLDSNGGDIEPEDDDEPEQEDEGGDNEGSEMNGEFGIERESPSPRAGPGRGDGALRRRAAGSSSSAPQDLQQEEEVREELNEFREQNHLPPLPPPRGGPLAEEDDWEHSVGSGVPGPGPRAQAGLEGRLVVGGSGMPRRPVKLGNRRGFGGPFGGLDSSVDGPALDPPSSVAGGGRRGGKGKRGQFGAPKEDDEPWGNQRIYGGGGGSGNSAAHHMWGAHDDDEWGDPFY